jgi:hydroxymethylpyrimidine/phosphomethylpyrimidine kinase
MSSEVYVSSADSAPLMGGWLVAVGGLDPSGGAGLLRDYCTATALGARVRLVGTAWTEQSPRGVAAVEPRAPDAVRAALASALGTAGGTPGSGSRSCETDAVKVGMVATPDLAQAIAEVLAVFRGPVVFDPVLAASSGGALFAGTPAALDPLVRRASLLTPNLAEAAALAGLPHVTTLEDARIAADRLRARGARAVLIKGGHLEGAAVDLLVTDDGAHTLAAERVPGPSPRGTGCALATAIAVELGRGRPLADAVAQAKAWLHTQIRLARTVGEERHL